MDTFLNLFGGVCLNVGVYLCVVDANVIRMNCIHKNKKECIMTTTFGLSFNEV